jgi:hypothetical protein
MGRLIDLSGRRFTCWLVVGRANHNDAHNKPLWLCRCDCDEVRLVTGGNLRSGISQSCGCLKSERSRAAHLKHGHCDRRHGKVSRIYTCWQNMKQRCNNANAHSFANYGGRGISYCEQWEQFVPFLTYNGEPEFNKTFDRINNDGNYQPGNVRWATRAEQNVNRRSRKRKVQRAKPEDIQAFANSLARAASAATQGEQQ